MKSLKRIAAMLLCCMMLAGVLMLPVGAAGSFKKVNVYTASTFTDVVKGSWYAEYVASAYEYGFVEGMGAGRFVPDSEIELSAIITLAARIHSTWVGDKAVFDGGAVWYESYYDYAVEEGIISASKYPLASLEDKASRYQVADVLASTLPDECYRKINAIYEVPDLKETDLYGAEVYKLYRAGILTGDERHYFNGKEFIKRSEVAAMVTRLADVTPRKRIEILPAGAVKNNSLTLSGKLLWLGMSESKLVETMGQPEEKLRSINGYTRYVYGTGDYVNLCFAGVAGGKVIELTVSGSGFDYNGLQMGAVVNAGTDYIKGGRAIYYTDSNDGEILHTLTLSSDYIGGMKTDLDAIADECKAEFYLTNAFRAYHLLSPYIWSDGAAAVAQNYSALMAEKNFFSHYGENGESTVGGRLEAGGVSFSHRWAENIAAGYFSAEEVHNGWINSSGHRHNLLGSCNNLGVGAAYNASSTYVMYWTQDFYS